MSKFIHSRITVSGPGGIICHEMRVIEEALQKMGYTVIVEDDHPADKEEPLQTIKEWAKSSRDSMEEYTNSIGKEFTEEDEKFYKGMEERKVILKAVHQPWGG